MGSDKFILTLAHVAVWGYYKSVCTGGWSRQDLVGSLPVVQATHNRLVVPSMLLVCPVLIGMTDLGGFSQGIMGLHIFG